MFPTALAAVFLEGATSNCNEDGSDGGGHDNNELHSSMVDQQRI